ncbi:hypothetical protein U9188_27090, partial [Escherichia coli]
MSKFTVDSFIVELGFNENVIKGLQRVEKLAMQSAQRIEKNLNKGLNRPGFPGECFICELRLPDHRFRWKHNKLFLLLPEEYGPAFPA